MERIEGITLSAIKFKDYDRILTVFTETEGVIKVMVKGAFSSKLGKGAITNPLCHIELSITKRQGEIWSCNDVALLYSFLQLRQNYASLEAAGDLITYITASQLLHKPAPMLYQLFKLLLEKLPSVTSTHAITTGFILKILQHEGLWGYPLSVPSKFTDDEIILLNHLATASTFQQLTAYPIEPKLKIKARDFFLAMIEQNC